MPNVTLQRNAFIFCRYSVALLVWSAVVLEAMHTEYAVYPLLLVLVIMVLSALLGVHRAPLVQLYTHTLGRAVPSSDVVLDLRGMRISHTLASLLALVGVVAVWRDRPFALGFLIFFALLKTFSAIAGCPLYKLYGCTIGGGRCCSFLNKR